MVMGAYKVLYSSYLHSGPVLGSLPSDHWSSNNLITTLTQWHCVYYNRNNDKDMSHILPRQAKYSLDNGDVVSLSTHKKNGLDAVCTTVPWPLLLSLLLLLFSFLFVCLLLYIWVYWFLIFVSYVFLNGPTTKPPLFPQTGCPLTDKWLQSLQTVPISGAMRGAGTGPFTAAGCGVRLGSVAQRCHYCPCDCAERRGLVGAYYYQHNNAVLV